MKLHLALAGLATAAPAVVVALDPDSFLKNDGGNGSLNTRRNEEAITRKDMRLKGEVPEGLMTPMYDPVLDAVCFTDPAYIPVVSDPKALYDDFVKIFDFGFEVS
jgi:hypothetical protein